MLTAKIVLFVCATSFFTARQFENGTGEGLLNCITHTMEYVSIDNWKNKLIGVGCDGASANMGNRRGLKGY